MIVEKKLEALGLTLPDTERDYAANASGARFVSHLAVGNMLYISGTCAMKDGKPFRQGVVGADLSLEQGYEAARYALLPTLGVIKYALGDLDRVQQAVQMLGFVNSSPTFSDQPRVIKDFAEIWRTTSKVVYSTTLARATSARTRIQHSFDADAVRRMKTTASRDITIGGPTLAAQAIREGLVDEFHLFLNPVVVGGGTPYFPDDIRGELELVDERRFKNGVVLVRYRRR